MQEKSSIPLSQFCSMIKTPIQNNNNPVSPKKHQNRESDTTTLKSPKQKNIPMSSKKHFKENKQSDTNWLLHKLVLKSPNQKNVIFEEFDSDVDMHVEKSSNKATENYKSPIIKRKLTNADKSIGNTIVQGNFFRMFNFKIKVFTFYKQDGIKEKNIEGKLTKTENSK